jgi:Uncharacterized conserved protein
MCGRFVSARKRLELLEEFGVERDRVAASPDPEPAPDYNVAPTKKIFAVLERPAREDEPQARELRVLRWGLVPSWAKEASIGSRMINARAETVAVKPAFRRAFTKRRCILPADGYYEWQAISDGGKKRKQPYFIYRTDGGSPRLRRTLRALAGRFASRRSRARLAVDGRDYHDPGNRRCRPDPRSHAHGDQA